MDASTLCIIDSSSLISLHNWRSLAKHHTVWRNLDALIRANLLVSPEEVYEEIIQGEDPLVRWAKRHRKDNLLFKKTTRQHVGIVKEILRKFPEFVEKDRPIPQADPFVVALACLESRQLLAQKCIVITEEKYSPSGRPRIPHVCAAYQLSYLSIHQLYVNEGWEL